MLGTTSAASAASTATAPTTAAAAPATAPSAGATARGANAASSPARAAKPASPSARARPGSAPDSPATSSGPSSPPSPTAGAPDRPHAGSASARTPSAASACSPAATPVNSTTSRWAFPPATTKVQLEAKWSFVGKKEKPGDPQAEDYLSQGDPGDPVAFDPDRRLVRSGVVGQRTAGSAVLLWEDVRERLGGRAPERVTRDAGAAYPEALPAVFGQEVVPPRTGKRGRPAGPRLVLPEELGRATVPQTRAKGRVVAVGSRGGWAKGRWARG